ncbi:hypothetical protein SORDD20_01718 [Streptococcus oralis]|nr:hypothetical protein SORDD20_01718 [Streptococcus oralis]
MEEFILHSLSSVFTDIYFASRFNLLGDFDEKTVEISVRKR